LPVVSQPNRFGLTQAREDNIRRIKANQLFDLGDDDDPA
jgi:hypothetical protein